MKLQKMLYSSNSSNSAPLNPLFEQLFPLSEWRQTPFQTPSGLAAEKEASFPCDIYEEGPHLVVELHAPAIKEEAIDISLDQSRVLRVKIENKVEEKERRYFHREIVKAAMERSIKLPVEVDGSRTVAEYKEGVLKILLPKKVGQELQKIAVKF